MKNRKLCEWCMNQEPFKDIIIADFDEEKGVIDFTFVDETGKRKLVYNGMCCETDCQYELEHMVMNQNDA